MTCPVACQVAHHLSDAHYPFNLKLATPADLKAATAIHYSAFSRNRALETMATAVANCHATIPLTP